MSLSARARALLEEACRSEGGVLWMTRAPEGLNRAEARVSANLAAVLELQDQGYLSLLPSSGHSDVQKWRITREGTALIRSR